MLELFQMEVLWNRNFHLLVLKVIFAINFAAILLFVFQFQLHGHSIRLVLSVVLCNNIKWLPWEEVMVEVEVGAC